MYRNITGKAIAVIAAFMILGFGAYAFAGWGMGMGGRGDYGANLTDEQIGKLEAERQAFFNQTQDLRQKLYERNSALQNEFAKARPDREVLKSLQAEISDLRSRFDAKRIDHMASMREIAPDAAGLGMGMRRGHRGYHGGYGPGQGKMMGQGHGRGFGNCPRF